MEGDSIQSEMSPNDAKLAGFEREQEVLNPTETFNRIIKKAKPISPVDRLKAPFRDYTENTRTQWKYVKPEEVEDYLNSKLFFDTTSIRYSDMISLFEFRAPSEDRPTIVPLDLVVNASGFKDWKGRDPKKYNKSWSSIYGGGQAKSLDVIKHYAGLSTKLPPVNQMIMFIQPDGKVFFNNNAGDSHRMAAAILRGDENIETMEVYAYLLRRNYL